MTLAPNRLEILTNVPSYTYNNDQPLDPPPVVALVGGAAEAPGLGFVYFVVINPYVLSANRVIWAFFIIISSVYFLILPPSKTFLRFSPPPTVDFWLLLFCMCHKFPVLLPPPPRWTTTATGLKVSRRYLKSWSRALPPSLALLWRLLWGRGVVILILMWRGSSGNMEHYD